MTDFPRRMPKDCAAMCNISCRILLGGDEIVDRSLSAA